MSSKTKKRVLVVDDQVLVAESLKMILELYECEVLLAKSGQEALSLFQPHTFAVIFTDFEMPKMNGHQFASIIKSRQQDQPVVLITAYGDLVNDTQPLLQIDAILAKPWTMEEVKSVLDKFGH